MRHFLIPTVLLLASFQLASTSEEGVLQGPEEGRDLFPGDFELFSCNASYHHSGIKWVYKFNNGTSKQVPSCDILEDSSGQFGDYLWYRRSLVRVQPQLKGLSCADGKEIQMLTLSVFNELDHVDATANLDCNDSPKIVLKRWQRVAVNRNVWLSNYVTDKEVHLPGPVTGLKLSCLANKDVKWVISNESNDPKEFSYTRSTYGTCHYAILILSPLHPTSAQKFICQSVDGTSSSHVTIMYPENLIRNFDFNKTQECIEHLGTTVFESQTLGWTTAGSSVLSIGMMFGVVFLKRQLDRQKANNNNGA